MCKKLLKTIVIGIFIVCALAFLFYPQVFGNVYEHYNKNSGFKKVVKDAQEIYLLGTYHSEHWNSKDFSLQNLRAVIENIHPDVLLVESRQDQIDRGNLADGPPEMLFCNLVAKENGISVKGIDWWQANTSKPGTTNDIRDTNIHNNILKYSKGSNKVLVLIGRAHIGVQLSKLKNEGYREEKFTNKQKNKIFAYSDEKFFYPKGMDFYIKKRIGYEKECIGKIYKTKEFINSANSIIKNLEDLSKKVEKVGEE